MGDFCSTLHLIFSKFFMFLWTHNWWKRSARQISHYTFFPDFFLFPVGLLRPYLRANANFLSLHVCLPCQHSRCRLHDVSSSATASAWKLVKLITCRKDHASVLKVSLIEFRIIAANDCDFCVMDWCKISLTTASINFARSRLDNELSTLEFRCNAYSMVKGRGADKEKSKL